MTISEQIVLAAIFYFWAIRYLESVRPRSTKKISLASVFQDVIGHACYPCHAMCFNLLTVIISIHSIHKITKIRNSETLNKMEDDTKDSTVQSSKDRGIELISRKVLRKRKKRHLKEQIE